MTRLHCFCLLGLLPAAAASALDITDARPGDLIEVAGFEFAPGKRFAAPLQFRHIDIYAPDARILVSEAGGWRELPRSKSRVFVTDPELTASRAYLVVDADQRSFEGAVFDPGGRFRISGTLGEDNQLKVHDSHGGNGKAESETFACGGSPVPEPGHGLAPQPQLEAIRAELAKGGGLHGAVVAVETDNELMSLRFGDNTSTATGYLVNLFAGLNTMFERDLGVRLLQGETRLRVSGVADPYPSPMGSSASVQLDEVSEHWRVNEQAVQRAFVMMLSGKSSNNCSVSGVAWVLNGEFGSFTPGQSPPDGYDDRNYCNSKGFRINGGQFTFGHFSVSQIFKGVCGSGTDASNDVGVVGHELGHNFGVLHTHCTAANGSTPLANVATNTIDTCFNGEAGFGCYAGPVQCPNEGPFFVGQGSIMSYCNFGAPAGANCGDAVVQRFHPTQQGFLDTRVATNVGNGCLTAISTDVGPTLTPSPGNNSTTAMPAGNQGQTVSRSISFAVSGGSGAGTTQLGCSGSGAVSVASGTPQTIAVGSSASPVVAQVTLSGVMQSGAVTCTATPSGASASNFTFNFTASPGAAACTGSCVFRDGFE